MFPPKEYVLFCNNPFENKRSIEVFEKFETKSFFNFSFINFLYENYIQNQEILKEKIRNYASLTVQHY